MLHSHTVTTDSCCPYLLLLTRFKVICLESSSMKQVKQNWFVFQFSALMSDSFILLPCFHPQESSPHCLFCFLGYKNDEGGLEHLMKKSWGSLVGFSFTKTWLRGVLIPVWMPTFKFEASRYINSNPNSTFIIDVHHWPLHWLQWQGVPIFID